MSKHKLYASAVIGLLSVLCFSASAFAFYRSDTVTASNSFDMPRVICISFDPQCEAIAVPDISISAVPEARLPANSFVRTGYSFAGWSYHAGSAETLIPDEAAVSQLPAGITRIRLYAVWTPNRYTVSFDDNGGDGSLPPDMSCSYDSGYDIPACSVSRSEHLFLGWNTEADGTGSYISPTGRIYNMSSTADAAVRLYAQWEDESDSVIETNWNRHADDDSNNNGTPDRMELAPGSTVRKDPSLKNHTDKEVYAYILAAVPAVSDSQNGSSSGQAHDIAVLNITPHWKLIHSDISSDTAAVSAYLYRYDIPLKAYGSSEANPYHSLRRADRSTDLMSGFTLSDNAACLSSAASIDITGVFIETSVTEDEADLAALSALGM